MSSGFEESIGAGILRLVQVLQRSATRARVKQHQAASGRITPYLECGADKSETLVWLHGFNDEPDSFLRAAGMLSSRYRIVMPAMPGFGNGWLDPAQKHTYESYASWMGEVAGALGGQRFHVMGNSLGGGTAICIAAALGPERIASLTAVNSGGLELVGIPCVADEMRAGHNLFAVHNRAEYQGFIKRVFARPPYIPSPVLAHLSHKMAGSADWYQRLVADLFGSKLYENGDGASCIAELPKLRVPTLIVWGDRDTLFPTAHGEYLGKAIAGAKLEVLPGVGHCPHLESPQLLVKAFRRFAATL